MKTTKSLFFSILFILSFLSFGQKAIINLPDVFTGKLSPQSLSQLQWKDNNVYTWVSNNSIVSCDVKKNKIDTLLSLAKLNESLKAAGAETMKRFPSFTWTVENTFTFLTETRFISYDLKNKKASIITQFLPEAEQMVVDPSGKKVAYVQKNNVYVSDNKNNFPVTADGGKGIKNGTEVHRNEWGIDKGLFWSPTGNYLAFYRMDETMVTDFPLVDISKRVAAANFEKYPMAGMESHHVTIGIYNNNDGKTIFLNTGEPKDQFLTNVTWGKDELSIYVAVLNRLQNHLKINQYDALTGFFIKTIYEEKNIRYVEPQHPMYFLNSNTDQFLWLSQRDGWNHFYLFDRYGKILKQLTKGQWVVQDYIGTDAKDEFLYFTASIDNPIETHIYKYELKTGNLVKLSNAQGQHKAYFSPEYKYFIDQYNSQTVPNKYELITNTGTKVKDVFESTNPLANYNLGETSIFSIKNKADQDLYCRLIKPSNFDASKKYPVLIYVYGGPHSQLVKNSWNGAGHFLQYMAQKGYVIFTMDNRGTSNRGFEFESCIHRHVGDLEMEDQMLGVDYLKKLPYVDSTRMGLDGWSYGGFLVLTMMLRNPGIFVSATCGGPVVDWKWYEIMYGERYMDRPDENMDGYDKASVLNYVKNLQGNLLIFQGGQDATVVPQHSLSFIDKCIQEGKLVDYFVYPNHEHNVRGIDRVHLWKMIERHHELFLK